MPEKKKILNLNELITYSLSPNNKEKLLWKDQVFEVIQNNIDILKREKNDLLKLKETAKSDFAMGHISEIEYNIRRDLDRVALLRKTSIGILKSLIGRK